MSWPCSRSQPASPARNSASGPAAAPLSVSVLYENAMTEKFIDAGLETRDERDESLAPNEILDHEETFPLQLA